MNLTSENPVPIEAGQDLSFTYSVHWHETSKAFDTRFNRYLEYDFFEHKIHWFSVFNSFMMVIFLCGLVFLILLRTLRNDFARYAKDEDLDVEGMQVIGEDTGWKQVHGDVFRPPENLEFFCAIVGTGWQLVVLVLFVILYAMLGELFVETFCSVRIVENLPLSLCLFASLSHSLTPFLVCFLRQALTCTATCTRTAAR